MGALTRNQSRLRSPLMEAMRLEPGERAGRRKSVATSLMLTSLVDAFSIILIFLLVQSSMSDSTIELRDVTQLPVVKEATALHAGTIVRIEGSRYFLDDAPISEEALAARLQAEKRKLVSRKDEESTLIVQAARDTDFARLASVIRAGSISGFQNFKFAVVQTGVEP